MVNVDRCKSVDAGVMTTDHALTIDMFEFALDIDAALLKNELKLPKPETNMLKRFANEKLQI